MLDCDLHTHSRFFHLRPAVAPSYDPAGVRMLLRFARRRALDGLAVTNHDFFREDILRAEACLPGIEISTMEGHLLVVGPDPPSRIRPGDLDPTSAVRMAHERGCATIIAHPFRNSTLLASDAEFDAIEINGKHPEHRALIESIARERELPVVGGSDAHFPFEEGRISTHLDIERLTPTAVVSAIREGRVEPVLRDDARTRVLRAAYAWAHRVKGHLNDPIGPRQS